MIEKEFLDEIYEHRALLVAEVCRLQDIQKEPIPQALAGCDQDAELRTRRSQLGSVDDLITSYIKIHK